MDNTAELAIWLDTYSHYAAAAGILLYLLLFGLSTISFIPPEHKLVRMVKWVAFILLLSPVGIHWYLSKYMVLWGACAVCATGIVIKIRRKLGI